MGWESKGFSGPDSVGELVDSLAGSPALVCGSGPGVFEEIDQVLAALEDWPVIFAVNEMGFRLQSIDHWASLHGEKLPEWQRRRSKLGLHGDYKTHCLMQPTSADYVWAGLTPAHFALSGLFAAQIAYVMGCRPIVLAGCPCEGNLRVDGSSPDRENFAYGSGETNSDRVIMNELTHQTERIPDFKRSLRSMSGKTREIFGGLNG